MAGVIVRRRPNTAAALATTEPSNPSSNHKFCPGICLLVRGARDISHKSHAAGKQHSEHIMTVTLLNSLN